MRRQPREPGPRRQRPRPRGGLAVLGLAALLVSFAGSATAAATITGARVQDGTLTARDVRDGSIAGIDVADGTLGPIEFSRPPVGPPGPRGPRGPAGRPGTSGLTYVIEPHAVRAGRGASWTATCPFGTSAVSGGASSASTGTIVGESAPSEDARSWRVGMHNTTASDATGYAWALCLAGTR